MSFIRQTWKKSPLKIIIPAVILLAFFAGWLIRGPGKAPADKTVTAAESSGEDEVLFWTCSMHPQIQQSEPGRCPICGMELIPVYKGEEEGGLGPREIKLSPYARKLAEVEESPVERREVSADVQMVGKIDYDERRVGYITAWAPGRIDKLFVDFTGVSVKKGQQMVNLYSPELYSAQQELIEAWRAYRESKQSGLRTVKKTAWENVESAREKLRLLGLTDRQIKKFEQTMKAADHVTITAPADGAVIEKHGQEGMYLKTGTRIYTIARLDQVWARLEAYESDLVWLREGQEMEFTTEAYPGEVFEGKIEFIDPFLDPKTRTVDVRATVKNPQGKLKPEMFVHGKVITTSQDLVRVAGMPEDGLPLTIPDSAPLITGVRAVVYVQDPEREGVYQGREITLGPRAGKWYLVKSGLTEGEMVVTNGNFKIDSALQILAKPSMMSPEGGAPPPGHHHGSSAKAPPGEQALRAAGMTEQAAHEKKKEKITYESPEKFREQLTGVVKHYMAAQDALAEDDLEAAQKAAGREIEAVEAVDMHLVSGDAHKAWMSQAAAIKKNAQELENSDDLQEARTWFRGLSQALDSTINLFGLESGMTLYRIHCPMAFGEGADWFQTNQKVKNPYYGKAMQKCGNVMGKMPAPTLEEHKGSDMKGSEHKGPEHKHE